MIRRLGRNVAAILLVALLIAGCATQSDGEASAGESDESGGNMETIEGTWEGTLEVPGAGLEITVRFSADEQGVSGNIDIPAQMAFELPLSNIDAGSLPKLRFELAAGPTTAVFDGEVIRADGGARIEGSFVQGPAEGSFSITLTAQEDAGNVVGEGGQNDRALVEEPFELDRPGVTLHGTLAMPSGTSAGVLVVIQSGSGPTDRNGNSAAIAGRNDSLKLLAEGLAQAGYATLRYDKRGIGESAVANLNEADISFDDVINDYLAVLSWAAADGRFTKLVPVGHSEGGLVVLATAAAASAAHPGLDAELANSVREQIPAVVTIASPGRPMSELLLEQLRAQLEEPYPELWEASVEVIEALREGRFVDDPPSELATIFRRSAQPFLISEFAYNAGSLSDALEVPHLVISGDEDLQVSPADAERLAQSSSSEAIQIEGMNHVLKQVPAGDRASNQRAYADPSFPLHPKLIPTIVEFLATAIPQ